MNISAAGSPRPLTMNHGGDSRFAVRIAERVIKRPFCNATEAAS